MIQVYSPGNRKYEKNGNATLIPNAAEIQVKLNGEWELILEHPIDKWGKWAYIREEAVIKAPCFHGEQLFVIRSKTISDSGVEAVAEPIFMEARDDCFLTDVRLVGKQAQVALDMMTAKNTKYSARSDISRTATAYYEYKNLVEAINGDDSNSFIKRWGGEILFNNYEIIINDHIGGDYGFQVLYGKNIKKDGLQEEIDTSEVVTRIYPKAYNGHKMSGDGYVDSTHSDTYPTIKAATIKFDDVKMQEDAQESDAENGVIICKTQKELDQALTIKCQEEFENGIDKPTVKIKADIVMLKNTEEYKDYAILEEVSLGDTVHCKNSKLGIETTARVIGLKYDAIREKVTYVEIGDFSYDYFKTTTTITDRINQVIRPDGSVMADKIAGYIDAAYASLRAQYNVAKKQDVMAILFENLDQESPLYGAMALGTQGLIISKERTADGRDWDWTTAMTANGMIANIIVAGTISDKTGTNFWNLDTGEFALSSRGFTIDGMSANDYFEAAKNMTMQLSNDSQSISVDANGNYGTFPSGVSTTPVVMYGNQDITKQCAFTVEKTNSITGVWNKDTVTYTVTGLTADGGWVEIKATYLGKLSVKRRFSVNKLYAGKNGEAGTPGEPGKDGRTSYFHVKYSNVPNPASASQMTEIPSKYIGTYTDFTQEDSTDPIKYVWSKFMGDPGKEGIPGENGADGKTSYLHIAYANSEDGRVDFSVSNAEGRAYIGTYADFTLADSTDPGKYAWALAKGENGVDGSDGGNTATVYLYQRKESAPLRPTNTLTYTFATGVLSGTINNGWSATIPNGTAPMYVIVATAYSSAASCSIPASAWTSPVVLTQNGENGKPGATGPAGRPGADGVDGIGIKSISEKYAISNSNTVEPTTWQDTPPTMTATNRYLWNYETITFTNDTTTTTKKRVIGVYGDKGQTGGQGKPGADGADGKGIKSITNYYLAHTNATGVTVSTAGWSTTPQSTTTSKKYLWNYEKVTYSDGTTSQTTPCVIGTHGATGATGATGPIGPAGKPGANGADGTDGKNGLNVTTVYLYQRKTSVPPKPTAAITYTFATGAVSGLTNGWSKAIPAGTAPLYVILATASSTGTTDSIAASEWSTPTIMTENGADGKPGAPGRTYFLEPSTLVLKKGQDNVISPGTVDFKAFYRDGNSASRTAYSGRFKIEETVDGTTWKTIYTSSANESSVKHSTYDYLTDAAGNAIITASGHGIVAAVRDIHMIRCTLYAAGGTTNALDTQSVTVVKDVKALTQEEVFNILTNNGAVKGIWMENGQLYISFTIAKGGEITLGGVNNGNGKLVILDSKGRQVGYIDNTGAHFNKGEFLGELKSGNDSTYIMVSDGNLSFYSYGKLVSQYGKGSNSSNVLYEKVYGSKSCNILRGATWFTTNEDNSYNSVRYDNGIRVGGGGKMRRDSLGKDVSADILCICTPPGNTYKELAGILFGDSTTAPRIYRSYSDRIEIAPGQSSGSGSLFCHGGFGCAGTKSRDVKTKDYSNRLLYCYEMPSPMFGDTGEAVTDESGTCYIYLDDIFAKTINSCMEYQVFLQKEGQGDLWVDLKESAYFIVKGTPGLKFSWEIKAKQRDYEYERLESTEVTRNDVEIIDYETQGQGLFEEYLLEKETAYEESN